MSKDKPFTIDILPGAIKAAAHANEDALFEAMTHGLGGGMDGFAMSMAVQSLLELERRIILAEFRPGPVVDVEEERARYVAMRVKIESNSAFSAAYAEGLKGHNECARANLDNSDGHMFSVVLPKFNSNGTHDPYGDRDVPWSQKR